MLGKDCPPITLLQTEQGLIPTINQKEADEVLSKKFKWAKQSESRDARRKAEDKRDAQKRKIQKAVFKESLNQIAAKARGLNVTDKFWLFLAKSLTHNWYTSDTVQELIKRREIPYVKAKEAWNMKWGKFLLDHLDQASGAEVRSVVVELIVSRGGHRGWDGKLEDTYKDACAIYGIDAVQIEKEIKASDKAKQKKAPKKKAPKKKATAKQKKLAV